MPLLTLCHPCACGQMPGYLQLCQCPHRPPLAQLDWPSHTPAPSGSHWGLLPAPAQLWEHLGPFLFQNIPNQLETDLSHMHTKVKTSGEKKFIHG